MARTAISGMGPGRNGNERMTILDQLLTLLSQLVELVQLLNIVVEFLRLLGLGV
jgi:hypothetical protein